ncbi:MAG: radical SAM protein [Patescibacteria group bacterium]|nr:radical SAM protein [Patescibacteria group bacterium]
MGSRRVKASAEHLRRFLSNLVVANILKREYLPPQIAVHHVTYKCNANCAWCSRKHDRQKATHDVSWSRIEQIFRSLRQVTPALYLTGGEPLLHERIEDMLKLARLMGFHPIVVNTNATLLEERSLVPELADVTIASLHSMDPNKSAKIFGIQATLAKKALENVYHSIKVAKQYGNKVVVNCVLAPDNAQDAEGVLGFCQRHEIPLAVTPAIRDHEAIIRGVDGLPSSAYASFLDRVMLDKRYEPASVESSLPYLRCIRYWELFDCRPTSILSVSPEGYVLNPCEIKYPHLPKRLAWIDGSDSLLDLLPKLLDGERRFSSCSKNCLKACYVEPALALEHPLIAISERLHY